MIDRTLNIAEASTRKAKFWKNKSVLWSDLARKLASTTRTAETVAEYKAAPKDRQDNIKDTGAFVGGYCRDGRRTMVETRSLIVLDADFATPDLWDSWLTQYGAAAVAYSTHKHTPERPRLRLVVPLTRDITPDEYEAAAHRLAGNLGIDQFDDSTYEPSRLMHYPSTSADGEYFYRLSEGPLLNPDEVLATYHDWHDASAWPVSSRIAAAAHRQSAQKQSDPLEKRGLVGAFCREYTITDAIAEFVPTYAPTADPDRYTYTEGSTAGGVVTYDDKFSYSHHATDPASGQLCNAFDLVRLHRFGALDEGTDPDKPITDRPSYREMEKFVTELPRVKARFVAERAKDAFDEPLPSDAPVNWRTTLRLTDKGALAQTIENAVIILSNDDRIAGRLAENLLDHQIVAKGDLPWRKVPGGASPWTDSDDAALRLWLEKRYRLTGKDKIFDAVNVVAARNGFHPVRDYLDACDWDGVPRLDTLLVDYLGADDNAYTRAVTRKALTAAVARVYTPGCKFDTMLTIRGAQGTGKSTLIAKLGGEWYSDSFTTLQGKEAYEQVMGVWLMEVGELAGMKKADAEIIKLFISKKSDRFRPAYGRRNMDFPRQCIFIGTTNESTFLRDTTGNRRFWVVDTPNRPKLSVWDITDDTVRQLWGEACAAFRAGETLYLPPSLEETAKRIQDEFAEENPRIGLISDYLDRTLPDDWDDRDTIDRRTWLENGAKGTVRRDTVCAFELWCEALGQPRDRLDGYAVKELTGIMAGMPGWRRVSDRKKTCRPYGKQKYWERKKT